MLKRSIVRWGSACVRSPLIAPTVRRFYRSRVNVVYYHGVWRRDTDARRCFDGLYLDEFARDMRLLCRFFTPVPLADLLSAGPDHSGRPRLAVTFDDGCDLTRSGATDVLDELGIPATTFVVLACVGNRHLMWQHKFSAIRALRGDERLIREFNHLSEKINPGTTVSAARELVKATRSWPMGRKDEYADVVWNACEMPSVEDVLAQYQPYADWDDLENWRRRGHAVGLHTRTHPFCSRLTPAEIEEEVVQPARELRQRLGASTVPFAYPFGDRFRQASAADIAARAQLSCMLGIGGLSRFGTPADRLERARGESGLDSAIFFSPLVKAARAH